MIKVLFVCLGNICRSPMAEAVFRDMVFKSGLSEKITVDSCGTAGYHTGEPPHIQARKTLDKYGISYDGIKASVLHKRHFSDFDYIIAMDEENLKDVLRIKVDGGAIVSLLSEYAEGSWVSVPDPWYTGNFEQTFSLVSEGCAALLRHIKEESGISF